MDFSWHRASVLVICVVAVVIYARTLDFPFVFDDGANIAKNPFIRLTELDATRLYEAALRSPSSSRPVANVSFALNYYEGEYDVARYRAVNIAIHVINGVLVYFLAFLTLKHLPNSNPSGLSEYGSRRTGAMALLAACLFVAHPVQTEAVTYIVQRMTSLATMFYLLAFLFYLWARHAGTRGQRVGAWMGCGLAWGLALGSKQIAVTFPILAALYEWYFLQDLDREWIKSKLKYLLALFGVIAMVALVYLGGDPLSSILGLYESRDFTPAERLLTQFRVIVFYLSLLLFPYPGRLNIAHDVAVSHSLWDPVTTLASFAVILALLALAWLTARRFRLLSFCLLWFFVNQVVESTIIGLEMVFEHRLYLPSVGLAILAGVALLRVVQNRTLALTGSIMIVSLLGLGTVVRNGAWESPRALWSDAVSKSPGSARAHVNLGVALRRAGEGEAAKRHYEQALDIDPGFAKAYFNLGAVRAEEGDLEGAKQLYADALRLKPNYPRAHFFLGVALFEQGALDAAIHHYSEVLRIQPRQVDAYNNLGTALQAQGRVDAAIESYREAIRIRPDYRRAHFNLGLALLHRERFDDARQALSLAAGLAPRDPEPQYYLGVVLEQLSELDQAERAYREAMQISAEFVPARVQLGVLLGRAGRIDEAIDLLASALARAPGNEQIHHNYGVLLAAQNRIDEAVGHYREALRLRPDYAIAHNSLGVVLLDQHRIQEARGHFEAALATEPDYEKARSNLQRARQLELPGARID